MALSKIQSESINLADTFAFSGTVSGAGTLVKTGSLTSTTDAGSYSLDSCFSATYLNYFVTFKYAIATDGNDLRLRFRTGGSTNSESNYQAYFRIGIQDGNIANSNNANGDHIRLA